MSPSSRAGSGTTSPCTRSRATPPSGKMFSLTWVYLRLELTLNACRASPVTSPRGTISCQATASESAAISSNAG